MMTTTNPNTVFKTTDSLIKTATKHPHNHIADTSARNTHTRSLWQRCLVAIALLVTCVLGVKAEKYVIYYQEGDTKYYMANVGGTLTSATTCVEATCVWEGTSGSTFSNGEKSICFEVGFGTAVSLTGTVRSLTIDATNKYLSYNNMWGNKYYIYYQNGGFYSSPSDTDYGTTRVIVDTPPTTIVEPQSITAQDISLSVGETTTVIYTILPDGAYDENVQFEVGNEAIASVNDNGIVKANSVGSTPLTIIAYASNGTEACRVTCTITVMAPCTTPTITIDATTKAVTLSCIDPIDATIYYTTDGTTPTNGSNKYTAPFSITNGTKVKAIAIKDGRIDSQVSSAELSNDGAVRHLVTEEGVAAAKDCIVIGVGYPKTTSAEYLALNGLTAHTKTQAEVDELVRKYKTCSDIQLPVDGKAYQFANYSLFNGGTKRYLNYTAGTALSTSTDPNDASVFVCRKLREGVYVFVTTDGKFITWMNSGDGYKGDGAFNGYSNSYSSLYSGYSDWNEITVKKNGTEIIDFGYVRMVARRFARDNDPNSSFIIKGSDGTWDKAGDNYFMQAPDDNANCYSSAWIITEVAHTNTEAQNRALEEIDAKETEKRTIPVPGITIDDSGQTSITVAMQNCTIYYTTNGEEPTESSDIYTAPFNVTNKTIVKAIAVRSHYKTSSVASCYYVTDMAALLGEGTEASPFEISTMEQWIAFAKTVNSNSTKDYHARLTADISGYNITIKDFSGTLDGQYHTISGLNVPLFATASNATIKNIMMDNVSISAPENAGAIASTASGTTRIYNCGVLATSESNICGNNNVGSIVGELRGNARVINCYSFANITSGNTVGGIVGNNTIASNAGNLQTLVMNCMYYGDITGGTSVSPIYGGAKISNHGTEGDANGINNYNYYRYEANIAPTVYNCALAAEERYLTRFEFYRHVLNSQRKLCAFYVTGSVDDYEEIAKWVLDLADPNAPQYPILKPWGEYASMMNRATTDRKVSTLAVTIGGTNAKGDAISATTTLDITNADPNIYDYNHYKVQLPYYNDHFTDNYTNNKVVTGWKITSITGGTEGTFSTTGDDRYNFADRNCTQKDLYDVSGRVFAQGGYFNVPEGVTAIKIEPYWGKAVYLSDRYHDVVYDNGTGWGFIQAGETDNVYNNDNTQTVWHSLDNIWAQLQLNTSAKSVYDNAVVLVGNYHSFDESWSNGTTPFTVMSVDENRDNEPDYGLYCRTSGRIAVNPIRFDFINHVGIGMAAKEDGRSEMYNLAIWEMKGWFELTETALAIYEEFEYDASAQNKVSAPLILNGGIFKQFGSTAFRTYEAVKTPYAIVGGNCYLYKYSPGCNTNTSTPTNTKFPPVSILGGECEEFYLSGGNAAPTPYEGYNALCYGNGGKIGTFAGAYQEAIDGDVIIKLDHMLIDEFYGGGVNDKKPITGSINVTINNSQVGTYCGGPKFGNMANDQTITTHAENTTFDRFFGAGYGGTSLFRGSNADYSRNPYPTDWLNTYYTNRRGYYYDGTTRFENRFNPIGILVGYETEFFSYAGGGSPNARFYTDYASLSVAEVRNVTSTLIGCTINGDLYGGGNLGKANGDISTTLDNCIVMGSAYAAGFSAAVPTCEVMPTTPPTSYSTYNANTGIYSPAQYPAPVIYTWAQADAALVNGQKYLDDDKKLIYTKAVDLSDLGTVRGNTTIKIKGNSHIHGSVFGGGNASKVEGDTHVHIQGGTIDGNVFGAGNQAEVTGKTEVVIGQ